MHTIQYPALIVTHPEGLNMNLGNKNPIVVDEDSSFSQQLMSSPIVFDSGKNKFELFRPNDSNSFGTVDFDANVNTKIDCSISHVVKSMGFQELNTSYQFCELERTQLPTILAMSVQNSQLVGYRSNAFYVDNPTAWLSDCPQLLSPFIYEVDNCSARIPVYNQDTVMYIAPITGQTFIYASATFCFFNPQNIITLDLDNNDYHVLSPETVLRTTPMLFEPRENQSAISANTVTAQETGICSNTELTIFWNRVSFTDILVQH